MGTAKGEFQVSNMREEELAELPDGGKLTHAGGDQIFTGSLEGQGVVDWLMYYRPDGDAHFIGMQRFDGALDGKKGTFLIEAVGDHHGPGSSGRWLVVDGSGTDQLEGVRGHGEFTAGGGGAEYLLDYDLKPD